MSKIEELELRKSELIEKYGVFFEKEENLSPMASRILAMLLINGIHGATFEELVSSLKASKSTISTNLNLLMSSGRVSYYTKTGDRKRHFTCFPGRFVNRIEKQLKRYRVEYELGKEMINYKEAYNECEPNPEKRYMMDPKRPYLSFLKDIITLLEDMQGVINKKFKEFK